MLFELPVITSQLSKPEVCRFVRWISTEKCPCIQWSGQLQGTANRKLSLGALCLDGFVRGV
jgi:hypothetical protein